MTGGNRFQQFNHSSKHVMVHWTHLCSSPPRRITVWENDDKHLYVVRRFPRAALVSGKNIKKLVLSNTVVCKRSLEKKNEGHMSFNPTRQTVYPETCAFPVKTCPRGGLTRRCEKVFCQKKEKHVEISRNYFIWRNGNKTMHALFLPHAEKRT